MTCNLNVELVSGVGEGGVTYPDTRTFDITLTAGLDVDLTGNWAANIAVLDIEDPARPTLNWLLKNGAGGIRVFQLNTAARAACLTLTNALDDAVGGNAEGLDLSAATMDLTY